MTQVSRLNCHLNLHYAPLVHLQHLESEVGILNLLVYFRELALYLQK